MGFWFVRIVPKHLNSSTLSDNSLPIFMSWSFPPFWSRDMTLYWVFLIFTSRTISLLVTTKVSVFLYSIMTATGVLVSSAYSWSWFVPFNLKTSSSASTFLISRSKAKLKYNDKKSYSCFRPLLIQKASDKYLPRRTLQ